MRRNHTDQPQPLLHLKPTESIMLAVWFGLLTGLAEAALLAFARNRLGRYTHLPADLIWISPLACMVLFGAVAALLIATGAVFPRLRSRRLAVFVLAFLGCLDVLFLLTQLHQAASLLLALGVAAQFERLTRGRAPLLDRIVRYTSGPLILVVVLGGVAFHVQRRNAERDGLSKLAGASANAPNLLLIIWDTVRASNLSLFGYVRPTTPVLERLAKQSVVFENAIASAPWTLPSHASFLTGALPHQLEADWTSPLDRKTRTLAEFLRQHGYDTAGFVGNTYYCSEESGLNRGFIHYEDFKRTSFTQLITGSALIRAVYAHDGIRHALHLDEEPGRKNAQEINRDVLGWLRSNRGHPFFAFVNYFDAHAPYLPPAPFDTRFGAKRPGRNPLISEERAMSREELRTEIDQYDGAIAYLDHSLGQLLDSLDARGILDNTIVVVAADHGEQFGEHGLISHGNSLYLPLLHVPLLIRAPKLAPAGQRVPQWVSLRDVPATLAELASPANRGAFPGRSLARFWDGSPQGRPDTLLTEVSQSSGLPARYPVSRGDMRSVIAAPNQFIANSNGTEEFYDLEADKVETHNLIRSVGPALVNEFRAVLREAQVWN